MSLRRKILLPILISLFFIVFVFVYLIIHISVDIDTIERSTSKIEKLNSINSKLVELQFQTDFNVLAYRANPDNNYLDIITNASVQKAHVLDSMHPLIEREQGKELVRDYIEANRNVEIVRNDFITSVRNKDEELIKTNFLRWNIQSQNIRATLADLDAYNVREIERAITMMNHLSDHIIVILCVVSITIIVLIIFLYYYLNKLITQPILKLAAITKNISRARFITSPIDIYSKDEIGSLASNIKIMNQKLQTLYLSLENKVKQKTRQIQEKNEEYKIIMDNFPNGGVALMDKKLRFIKIGGQSFNDLGLSPKLVEGKFLHEVFPKSVVKRSEPFIKSTLEGKETTFETTYAGVIYLVRNIPIINNVGEVTMFISLSQNISKEKEIEKQKDSFIGIASHELKTPITSISAFTQVLEKELAQKNDEKNLYLASNIKMQTVRLVRLVDGLLNVSKLDSGMLDLHMKEFDMDKLIDKLIVDFQFIDNNHSIEKKGKLDRFVLADENRIEQIITNLLTNAIKYSPDSNKIIIHLTASDGQAVVGIQDFGLGIAKADQRNLFQRFYRTKERDESKIAGFGLGLYIASEIIKKHHGSIWVKSTKGKGSTFYFSLPLDGKRT